MAAPEGFVAVPGSETSPPAAAQAAGPVDAQQQIEVTVLLRHRPSSPELSPLPEVATRCAREGRYLSREELSASYGASPDDVAAIQTFARQHNLVVVSVNMGARTVILSGTVQALSGAFKVDLARYEYQGRAYRCRTGAIYVPTELGGIVIGVLGFDNWPAARPHYRVAQAAAVSYTPIQVARLYSFPANLNGSGEAIGIIELGGGYNPQDLKNYFSQLGITPQPSVSAVSVGGAQNVPTGDPNGPDAEVMLDIEVAGSVAPGASIVVYFAENTSAGFLNAINTAVHDTQYKPSVISISWGGPESTWTAQDQNAFNSAFQAAGALGVTVCCASGDDGSTDGVSDGLAHVDFPASSPYVVGCGGTSLNSSNGSITKEVVWDGLPNNGASGGGVSDVFPLPSWQANAHVPASVNPGNFRGRGVPDVAGDADPDTGYQVLVDSSSAVIGGTSAVAPLWAGLIACLNQGLGRPLGYLNPALYSQIAASSGALRDITSGTNGSYQAAAGWDACTGWGSPDGSVILSALGAAKS